MLRGNIPPTQYNRDAHRWSTTSRIGEFHLAAGDMKNLVQKLLGSPYAHFQEQAAQFDEEYSPHEALITRIVNRKATDGSQYINKRSSELEEIADDLAKALLKERKSGVSQCLADINRILWLKDRDWVR